MNIILDSPSKLRNGEGVQFPATIRFKSQLSSICFAKNEQKFKKNIAPTTLPFTESDILASIPGDKIYFHIFDPAMYTPSSDLQLNTAARKKLQNDLAEACSRTGGFKGVWTSLQPWGPRHLDHYCVSTLKCANSFFTTRSKTKVNNTTSKEKPSVFKLASTNNSRSLHSVAKGNSKRKRKTSK